MSIVTVDLEDLKALVFGTSALKQIESALSQAKRDPFVQQHMLTTEAHDRLASAMRNAERAAAGTLTPWDGALEDDEIKALRKINAADLSRIVISPEDKRGAYDRLEAKGCIRFGQIVTGIVWAGAPAVSDVVTNPKGFAVQMTPRGMDKLAAIEAAKIAAAKNDQKPVKS